MTEVERSRQDTGEPDFQPPPRRRLLVPLFIAGSVVLLAVILYVTAGKEVQPLEVTDPFLSQEGPPAIRLRPSLIVPGPMQNPHPVEDGGTARPDEAAIFRVDVRGKGYVMVALETPSGKLARVWGGRPDDTELTGSHLLYDRDTGMVLAVDLGPHRGTTVTFVTALSTVPWDPFPASGIPQAPRTFPDEEGEGKPPNPQLLAWDRFTIHVQETLPSPTPEE